MRPRDRRHVVVTAAVIERDGAFLMARRLDGTHLAGHWEFPGGKRQPGETLEACLIREIKEELDAEIDVGVEILATTHEYPERVVELRFFRCELKSDPRPVLGQALRWVPRADLCSFPLPPADNELVRRLIAREI
ncbi:MAG: (deoxy)nucleoside triphosphate pyrophosphohydrolase [Acidobacteria bacterium]|nr:(deoxy)nucleoside triphosphate pyrophosphohydrolase [Acidobacteriota bacterium]